MWGKNETTLNWNAWNLSYSFPLDACSSLSCPPQNSHRFSTDIHYVCLDVIIFRREHRGNGCLSGHFMCHQVQHSAVPHSVFMGSVWIWEQTATVSLYSIDWMVYITEMGNVYCVERAGSLRRVQVRVGVQRVRSLEMKVEFYIIALVNLMYSNTCKLFASVNTRTWNYWMWRLKYDATYFGGEYWKGCSP